MIRFTLMAWLTFWIPVSAIDFLFGSPPNILLIVSELPFVEAVIAAAPELVRTAYQRQQRPPRYELYDLRTDPHEWTNLADTPRHASVKADLAKWLPKTDAPDVSPRAKRKSKAQTR
ncbi:MAG: hypothetical protein FJ276_08935 [Planctomycetes bacterium]|nr:hypothetical protein [Planctomycetota bacterium]